MAESVCYVYGIVPSAFDPRNAPEGVEEAPVSIEAAAGVGALVSSVDAAQYAPARLESNTADVEWLAPRALAHDRVLSWAADRGATVPLPMFSLFTGPEAVRAMLRDRAPQLSALLTRAAAGREYALRVYRVDAELLRSLVELSPRLAELQRDAERATPGQRYLLERKLDAERKAELRVVSHRVATDIYEALAAHALEGVRSPCPQAATPDSPGIMVLNAAFLVAPESFPAYQHTLSELVAARQPHGFRFDFTGPWPAYHFVQDGRDDA